MDFKLTTFTLLVSIVILAIPAQGEWLSTGFFGSVNEQPPHKFLVSFRIFDKFASRESKHFCGGVILNEHWIVSSASCFAGKHFASKIVAVVGVHGAKNTKRTHEIRRIVYHSGSMQENNIVLIETATPITLGLNANVEAIRVSSEVLGSVKNVSFVAWNETATDENHSFVKHVKMDTMTNRECEVWLQPKYGRHISNKMMCAYGMMQTGTDQNDAGYPLVHSKKLELLPVNMHAVPEAQIFSHAFFLIRSGSKRLLMLKNE